MQSLSDRFRRWYDFEKDCNAKVLEMLKSVPEDKKGTPQFDKAVGKMAHTNAARQMWLFRLGKSSNKPDLFPNTPTLSVLQSTIAATEAEWEKFLKTITDADLSNEFTYQAVSGKRFSWTLEGVLTQLFGHAWYHRGQIASLVADLGGKAVDTDYVFWCKLTPIES